jgi:hypothetical protein
MAITAVARLHHLVSEIGYSERDILALRELAAFGFDAETSASIVLVAMTKGHDTLAMARKFIEFAKIGASRR